MCIFVGRIVISELWPGAVIGVHRLAQRDHAKINRARCWLFIYTGNNAIIDEPVDLEPCLESLFLVFVWVDPQFQCLLRFHWLVYNRIVTCVNKQPTPCYVNLGMIALREAVDTNNGAWPKLTGNNPSDKDAHGDL